jgi:Cutinase
LRFPAFPKQTEFSMKKIFFLTIFLTIFSVNAFVIRAQIMPCTLSKATTLPLAGEYGSFGQFAVTRLSIPNPDPNAPAPISVFVPSNATPQTRVPVVFFAHGFGGTSYQFYETLLRQLASNGYIVVFSPYTANLFTPHATRYNQLWNGFLTAVQQHGNLMDTTRVGFAGHSYGAGATPEMSRHGTAQGWGANGLFLFIMAAWYNWGANPEQIPATAKMIVQVYWDDETNQHLISQNDVWNKLPQITERKWQVIRASRTFCSLDAGHTVPVTDGLGQTEAATDAYDAWGIWRRLHALSDYTFNGNQTAKNIAFGADTNMGRWRGIFGTRRISPLEATDAPVVNSQSSPTFLWSQKCTYALGSPCP